MSGRYHHEEIYRGAAVLTKLADVRVTLCGAGALGSNLADTLARQGFRTLRIIDCDRVEEQNVGTQTYGLADVGASKTDVLRNQLFRAAGVEVEAFHKELDERNARKLLKGSDVVVDLFDNAASRRVLADFCGAEHLPCLHAGLFADYGEVIWNEQYRVPGDAEGDVCDYPLARNLILLTVAVTAETLVRFVAAGEKGNWSITLGDFGIRVLEPPG